MLNKKIKLKKSCFVFININYKLIYVIINKTNVLLLTTNNQIKQLDINLIL